MKKYPKTKNALNTLAAIITTISLVEIDEHFYKESVNLIQCLILYYVILINIKK